MYKTNFDFIVEKARAVAKPLRVALAGADAENILMGLFQAQDEGFADPILLGNEEKIIKMLKDLSLYAREYKIVNVPDDQDVVQAAVDLVRAGKADMLLRGNVQTRQFLMPILDKKNDLIQEDRILTHVVFMKVPEYKRILAISDVTILPEPNEYQREQVIRNMVNVFEAFGYECPNIALLSLIEKPAFHMRDTTEAQNIVRRHKDRPLADCKIVGPIAYDLIISKEAARLKGYDCDLCGEFDGIVTPSLLAGNLLVKAMQIHGHATNCGILAGAKIPCAITSRSDTREQAFLSIAACAALPEQKVTWNL